MKFKNKETGTIREVSLKNPVKSSFCKDIRCRDCKLNGKAEECTKWVLSNPKEAAELMGYELITDLSEEPVEPQKEAPETVSKGEVYNDLIGLEVSLTAASFNAAYGRNPTPDFTGLRKKLTDMKAKYQPNSCPLCRPGGVIYRTVKGKNGGLRGLCGTVDELNFCPGCSKPLNDKGRQIQKETLGCAAEEAAKLV